MTPDDQDERSRRENHRNHETGQSTPDSSTGTSNDDHPDTSKEQKQSHRLARYWEGFLKRRPSAQAVWNGLLTIFTFFLVVIAYQAERPQVVVRAPPFKISIRVGYLAK